MNANTLPRLSEDDHFEVTSDYVSHVYFPRLMTEQMIDDVRLPAVAAPMGTPEIERQSYAEHSAFVTSYRGMRDSLMGLARESKHRNDLDYTKQFTSCARIYHHKLVALKAVRK